MNVAITITLDEARAVSNALRNAVKVIDHLSAACTGSAHADAIRSRLAESYHSIVETLREWDEQLPGGAS